MHDATDHAISRDAVGSHERKKGKHHEITPSRHRRRCSLAGRCRRLWRKRSLPRNTGATASTFDACTGSESESGSFTHAHSDSDPDAHSDSDPDADSDSDPDADADTHANADTYSNACACPCACSGSWRAIHVRG
jgi:hypothetical protein